MADYITKESVHTMVRHLTKFAWASPVGPERRVTVDADEVNFGVDKIPAADVAPVVHGCWKAQMESEITGWLKTFVRNDRIVGYICSNCGDEAIDYADAYFLPDYCPNCGAKMDGGELDAQSRPKGNENPGSADAGRRGQ